MTFPGASDFVPSRGGLPTLRRAVQGCRGCDLHRGAIQAVFGEGTRNARLMLVGEQPGDREDLEGEPFVGPAGRVLDRALEVAGIDRRLAYVTNAVKHFRFTERGKRRIHRKPSLAQITACRPWLEAEVRAVRPQVIVGLGATAARALLGPGFKVGRDRMQLRSGDLAPCMTATVHPSSILRAPDDDARRAAMDDFVADLRKVATLLD